jgi:aarF domain-containing kinase
MQTLIQVLILSLMHSNYISAKGNFLLMPDERIAMLDYGQVKKLSSQQRLLIARMVLAVLNKDEQAILQLYNETGYRSKYMNPKVMCKTLVVVLDRDGADVTDGRMIPTNALV